MDSVEGLYDPIRVAVRSFPERRTVELYFFRLNDQDSARVAIPHGVTDEGGIIWKDQLVPYGATMPPSLIVGADTAENLMDALVNALARGGETGSGKDQLIESLQDQVQREHEQNQKLLALIEKNLDKHLALLESRLECWKAGTGAQG